ncbi:MAG: hypothetical protein, partial [Olavius algarvensis Gamma 1 endosymbiont]
PVPEVGGCRLPCQNRLRPPGREREGIQPTQTWCPFLPSAPGLLYRYQGNPPGLASHRQRLHEQRD